MAMNKKVSNYELDNALFVLAQLNDALQKGGLTSFVESTNELKVNVTKIEVEVKSLKEKVSELKSKKEGGLRFWSTILVPLVMILLAFGGHWYYMEQKISTLEARVEVLNSIVNERDKTYDAKFLQRNEYLRDMRRKNDNNPASRR